MNETSIKTTVENGAVAGVAGAETVTVEQQTNIGTIVLNLATGIARAPAPEPTGPIPPCPYPGLAYFGPEDASRFFGREQAISALVAVVAKRSFTALVGASGSGKSSVVLAGLAPRLVAQGSWRSTYFRIGTEADKNPFAALARALEPLTGERGLSDKLEEVQKLAEKIAVGSGPKRLPLVGEQQRRRLADRVRMVEHHPRMVVLRDVDVCTLFEPMDSPGQRDDSGERTGRHQGGRPLSGDPLEPHQQRQLPLHVLG